LFLRAPALIDDGTAGSSKNNLDMLWAYAYYLYVKIASKVKVAL
jgi:hypothetical protein